MNLSIIIPVYNEEKTIGLVLKRLESLNIPNVKIEIIIVDDGSTDATASVISNFIHSTSSGQEFQISNWKVIHHKKNRGKGAAIQTGIKYAKGDYILIQDADLEYNPNDIPSLVKPILGKKAEVVYGTRLRRPPDFKGDEKTFRFFLHYVGNRFLSLVTSILYGQWLTDMETCYKLFPKKTLTNIVLKAKGFDFEPEITSVLLKKKYKILEVSISTNPRSYDEGKKLNTFRDGIIALWTLFKYRIIN